MKFKRILRDPTKKCLQTKKHDCLWSKKHLPEKKLSNFLDMKVNMQFPSCGQLECRTLSVSDDETPITTIDYLDVELRCPIIEMQRYNTSRFFSGGASTWIFSSLLLPAFVHLVNLSDVTGTESVPLANQLIAVLGFRSDRPAIGVDRQLIGRIMEDGAKVVWFTKGTGVLVLLKLIRVLCNG